MTVFDLIFLLSALVVLLTLLGVLGAVIAGKGSVALRMLRTLGAGVAVYLLVGLAVSALRPQRVIGVGEPWCFDDWCLSVEQATRTAEVPDATYRVDLRIFSRARRITQRANGAWLYLVDDRGHRYAPDPNPSAVPLNVTLAPSASVRTSRVFHVPADAHELGLVTGHGGPYCGVMSFAVIGEAGCLFHKPTMIGLH